MKAERLEQQQRLQLQERKFDHLIRAYHLDEMLVRHAISEEYRANAPRKHEEYEKERVAKAQ
jgi:hypothetical protein